MEGYTGIIMIVLLFAVFYFFLIRPENKKKKQLQQMRSALQVGDQITTIGGMVLGVAVNGVAALMARSTDLFMQSVLGLAFGFGLGWLFDPAMRSALLSLMLGQYLVKFVLAALDTLPFYLLTRETKR